MKTKIETTEAIKLIRNAKSVEEIRNVIKKSNVKCIRREYRNGNPYITMEMRNGSLLFDYNNNMPNICI